MRRGILGLAIALASCGTAARQARGAGEAIGLAGTWRFALDRADAGELERWFARDLPGEVRLPGDLAEQGIGDPPSAETRWTGGIVDRAWFTAPEYARYREPGRVKVPFWLQPERHYVGAAWYQRDLEIPEAWRGRRVELYLERPHMETRVWIGERWVGASFALGTPHVYDLGALPPGRHALTIRVDNRMAIDVGENSHCVSDHTQGNWNGIVGRIEIRARPPVWIDEVQVYPSVARRSATFRIRIGNATARPGRGRIEVEAGRRASAAAEWTADGYYPSLGKNPLVDPFKAPFVATTCGTEKIVVVRGGRFAWSVDAARSANRASKCRGFKDGAHGFRCVRSLTDVVP